MNFWQYSYILHHQKKHCNLVEVNVVINHYVLRKQTVFYVKISTLYTNKFMSCEMTLDEYTQKKKELNDGINSLLRWYMKKEGIIDV